MAQVSPGGPAEKAGLKSGDVVTALNGTKIKSVHDLVVHTVSMKPGTDVTLTILRDQKVQTLKAKIGNMPKDGEGADATSNDDSSQSGSGKIGISLAPLSRDMRQQLGVDDTVKGAVINQIAPGSPAEQAGVRPGDIIQAVGNTQVDNPRAVLTAVRGVLKSKQPILLRVLRDGQQIFIAIAPSGTDTDDDGSDDSN